MNITKILVHISEVVEVLMQCCGRKKRGEDGKLK
jgi:hypothetical protein